MKIQKLLLLACALFMVGCQSTAVSPDVLSSLELKNAKQPVSDIITGGQPTKNDLAVLKENGIDTIINLRTEGEFDSFNEASIAKAMGLNYISLPISGRTGLTEDNAKKLDKLLNNNSGSTLIHCGSGNRVGALMALRAFFVDGKSADEALAIGDAAGLTSLRSKVEKIVNQAR